ncbi:interleukin-9 receptor-like [Paroedura picta]|uniref:interleukin-9 receptor-like n=1 Tax=Paroedura picta TaxID=143630 RepID=UPI004056468D
MVWENLRTAGLLQVLISPLFLAAEGQKTGISSGVRCLNSYGFQDRRVDCTWLRNQTKGEGPFYLNFSDTFEQGLKDLVCWLLPSNKTRDEFRCSAEGSGEFQENDLYKVSLHDTSLGEKASYAVWEDIYKPMRNIKCDPPYDFRSNMSGGRCLITWEMPKAYVLIWKDMQWQLQLRATHVPWEQAETKAGVSEETWMEIDAAEFTPGTSYVARLRCKTPDKNAAYVSHWSEWSGATEWSVPPGPLPQVLLPVFVWLPLCLGALLCLLLLAGCHSRIKSCCWPSTPNPAAFFLPLYASHRGDFQAWIGIRKPDAWLRGSGSSTGPGLATHRPLEEAVSQLSLFRRLSEAELPTEARVHHLLGAPNQQDKASNYVVIQGATQVPVLPGRAPLLFEGLNDFSEGFPYLPYKNSLFVA